jgi:hypothetical protein
VVNALTAEIERVRADKEFSRARCCSPQLRPRVVFGLIGADRGQRPEFWNAVLPAEAFDWWVWAPGVPGSRNAPRPFPENRKGLGG